MNKKIASIIIFAGLFCLASFAFAEIKIDNPLANGGVNSFGDLLTKIATGIGVLVGSIGVIMIIWAGILYLTSAGSPEKMTKAKTALTYAIIGIAIGIAAPAIVAVVKSVLGIP